MKLVNLRLVFAIYQIHLFVVLLLIYYDPLDELLQVFVPSVELLLQFSHRISFQVWNFGGRDFRGAWLSSFVEDCAGSFMFDTFLPIVGLGNEAVGVIELRLFEISAGGDSRLHEINSFVKLILHLGNYLKCGCYYTNSKYRYRLITHKIYLPWFAPTANQGSSPSPTHTTSSSFTKDSYPLTTIPKFSLLQTSRSIKEFVVHPLSIRKSWIQMATGKKRKRQLILAIITGLNQQGKSLTKIKASVEHKNNSTIGREIVAIEARISGMTMPKRIFSKNLSAVVEIIMLMIANKLI